MAEDIGYQIARRAIRLADGRCGWMGPGLRGEDGWSAAAVTQGPALYDGTAGIALFFAELFRSTGEPEFADLARGALKGGEAHLDAIPEDFRASFYLGWSGVAHATVHCGSLLEDRELGTAGLALFRAAAEVDGSHSALDLLQGAAGAAPSFLDTWRRTGESSFRAAALEHAQRLIATAVWKGEFCSWPTGTTDNAVHLCGLSHGAAGIALALLTVWREVGDEAMLRTALGALAYEEFHFDCAAGGWADLRPGHGGYPVLWCHGAGGGALAHARAAALLPAEAEDIRARCIDRSAFGARRIAESLRSGMGNDSLCHGFWGLVWCLRLLGEEPEAEVLNEGLARLNSRPFLSGVPGGAWTPNLMLGAAGAGLALLGLADTESTAPPLLPPGTELEQ